MTIPFIAIRHQQRSFYLCKLAARLLCNISYVARRGESDEKGAVQRILNKSRITGIKDYVISGGFFPNNIILNLVKIENITLGEDSFELIDEARIAQVIDGQHRVEGLREAISIDPEIGEEEYPVLLTIDMSTADCAELFISINTEQKVVPRSLIYDLYGVINIENRDFSIDRGTDIARQLNEDEKSSYKGLIKFPGSRRFKGGIQLSTFVNNIKPLVKKDGEFSKYSITTLETQINIISNYFRTIEFYYDKEWDSLKNPFLYGAGFGAAIDVFQTKILPYCYTQKKFTEELLRSILEIPKNKLILQAEVKNLGGDAAREYIRKKLTAFVNIAETKEEDFEI